MEIPQTIESWRVLSAIRHTQNHEHFDTKCPHPLECHFLDALAETYGEVGDGRKH